MNRDSERIPCSLLRGIFNYEHIYRHHRRYRITEGAEEIQMRRVAGYMFGFMKQQKPKGGSQPGEQRPNLNPSVATMGVSMG